MAKSNLLFERLVRRIAKSGIMPNMTEHEHELERFDRDIRYLYTHRSELMAQHPEKWVAIFNEEVAGISSDPYQLIQDLKEKGVPASRTKIDHLTQNEPYLDIVDIVI